MALSVSQMQTVSYPEVLAEMRKPENQWMENAFMRELERQGAIERINGAPVNEIPLDYKRNPDVEFQTDDLGAVSTSKTDVLTAGQFTNAQIQVPITWSKKDEIENSSVNQKIAMVKSLLENGINSHDDALEEALFVAQTGDFYGLPTIVPDAGQGTVHGIDAALETWWRSGSGTYASNGSDIVAKMTAMWNTLSKGTGSSLSPKILVSDAETQAIYEATQQGLRQYTSVDEANAGFKVLAFKTARYSFSQFGLTKIYFLNPKSFRLTVVKQAYRLLGDTKEFIDAAGYTRQIYTLAQTKTSNKSRLGVLTRV